MVNVGVYLHSGLAVEVLVTELRKGCNSSSNRKLYLHIGKGAVKHPYL